MNYDLVVIGAGPAGMSSAIQAASHGAKVAIVDENPTPGGKLLGQLHEEPDNGWWIGKNIAQEFSQKVNKLKITCYQEKEVWGIFPKWKISLNSGEELEAKYALLATGAAEKPVPIPGWTLPGVMAIGAAQVLTNFHRVKPGKKAAIIGVDPLSLTVAQEMKMAGVDVVGIFLPPSSELTQEKSNPKLVLSHLAKMADIAPSPLLKVLGKLAAYRFIKNIGTRFYPPFGMKISGTPLMLRKTILSIEGEEMVTSIQTASIHTDGTPKTKSQKSIDVDCVCISGGLYPLTELANLAGCESIYISELGGHIPFHSIEMETTQPGIFVAGNITGIESAKVAMAQGELAGTTISARLGLVKNPSILIKNAQQQVVDARKSSIITFQPDLEQGLNMLTLLQALWEDKIPRKEGQG